MPRKSRANRARAANLQREKILLPKPTVEELESEDPDSDSHNPDSHAGCCEADDSDSDAPRKNDIIGDDVEFFDVIGCLRGAMVRDEDERSVSDSEESEDD